MMPNLLRRTEWRRILLVLAFLAIAAGCGSFEKQGNAASSESLTNYLPAEALPSGLTLVSPPPAVCTAPMTSDEEIALKARAMQGTSRWELATQDNDLSFPNVAGTFSCALNAPITEKGTPRLYTLLRRSLEDTAGSTGKVKVYYKRLRPFLANGGPVCISDSDKEKLKKSFSYPSGHSALGWAWALILTEIAPDRADQILARGRAFGQSRVICNVHWQSDVDAGRVLGAAAVARLHADPAFRADLEAARAEVATVRAKGLKPTRDCAAEATALVQQSP